MPGQHLELAVVVPAHNEQELIGRCVRSLLACSSGVASFKAFVVADNCTDETAEQARVSGARVLERVDPLRRGNGHALEFAFARLIRENFDAFVVVDADSVVPPNFVDEIAGLLKSGADAVLPSSEVGLEPLHAVYRREACLPLVEGALLAGKRKLIAWHDGAHVIILPPDTVKQYDPQQLAFWNVNTPDEFLVAENKARQLAQNS